MNKRVTRKDVAKLAGVSETTVSIVVNNRRDIIISPDTRRKVLLAAKKLDYHPSYAARAMVTGKARTIGVLSHWNVQTWFFAQMLNGISSSASVAGYGVLLCNMLEEQKKPEDCIKYFHENRIDGVIYLPPTTEELPGLYYLMENNIPTIVGNGVDPYDRFDYVVIDYAAGMHDAASHLIGQGFKQLYYFYPGNDVDRLSPGDRERVRGFKAAIRQHPDVCGLTIPFDFEKTPEERFALCKEFIRKCKLPAGIVTCWWQPAYYIQMAATVAGMQLGKDISVLSGDRPAFVADLHPPVYGIELPFFEIGRECANMLIERLDDDKGKPVRRLKMQSDYVFP